MKKAGIRDVALHAGVSTATVSHVLNKTRYVSPETTALVMESIKALNYSPNEAGRSLKTGKKKLVGNRQTAAAGRKEADGSICHQIAVSAQSHRDVGSKAGRNCNG